MAHKVFKDIVLHILDGVNCRDSNLLFKDILDRMHGNEEVTALNIRVLDAPEEIHKAIQELVDDKQIFRLEFSNNGMPDGRTNCLYFGADTKFIASNIPGLVIVLDAF